MVELNDEHGGGTPSSRRTFLKSSSAAVIGSSITASMVATRSVHAAGSDEIRIGLIGCGGRGTGAAQQALTADPQTRLVAAADAFSDRIEASLASLRGQADIGSRVTVDSDHKFDGFDGYRRVL